MLPWGAMMRAAMRLGIGPSVFWEMSVREWRWLAASDDALDVPALRALMAKADLEDDNGTV